MAASVACAVAWKSGVIRSFGSIFTSGHWLIVEPLARVGRRKRDEDIAQAVAAEAALPSDPKRHSGGDPFSWCGSSGASVATTTMIEP